MDRSVATEMHQGDIRGSMLPKRSANNASAGRLRPPSRSVSASQSLPSLGRRVEGALQWLPPSRLQDRELQDAAGSGAESMVMASWLSEFDSQTKFGSNALFIEMQLRQALAATAAPQGQPDRFRTACVCEALARLPQSAGSFAGVLLLLRKELLRAVYVDHEKLEKRRQPVDAQGLLQCTTFFAECAKLRERNAEQEERLADWYRAKDELAQDSDGRNELLRLAVARWNTVLATVKSELRGLPEVQETARKLSGLLDSMLQHSKAIDELQRLSLLDPVARIHSQVDALGTAVKKRLILALVQSYGGMVLSQQEESGRLEFFRTLLMALGSPHERLALVRTLATQTDLVGSTAVVIGALIGTLPATDAASVLCEQTTRHAAGLRSQAARHTFREAIIASLATASGEEAPSPAATAETRPQARVLVEQTTQTTPMAKDSAAQTTPTTKDHRADVLAATAAEIGPEATAALPRALRELDQQWRAARPMAPPETRDLLPLVKALEQRCAEQSMREASLIAEIERLRSKAAGVN